MTCENHYVIVGRGLLASPLACTQRSADVERGLPLSSVPCTHRLPNVERSLLASSVAYTHHLPTSNVASPNHPWLAHIGLVASVHRPSYVERGLAALFLACAHWPSGLCRRIGQVTSNVAWQHRPWLARIWQRQAASAKTCKHLTWHVRIGQAMSSNGKQHQPRPTRI